MTTSFVTVMLRLTTVLATALSVALVSDYQIHSPAVPAAVLGIDLSNILRDQSKTVTTKFKSNSDPDSMNDTVSLVTSNPVPLTIGGFIVPGPRSGSNQNFHMIIPGPKKKRVVLPGTVYKKPRLASDSFWAREPSRDAAVTNTNAPSRSPVAPVRGFGKQSPSLPPQHGHPALSLELVSQQLQTVSQQVQSQLQDSLLALQSFCNTSSKFLVDSYDWYYE